MSAETRRLRPGDDGGLVVDPQTAGWRYLTFSLHRLTSNALAPLYIGRADRETAVVILAGGALMTFESKPPMRLPGRTSVFDSLPWAGYLPAGETAAIEPIGEVAEVAVVGAPASSRPGAGSELTIIGPDAVAVELQGTGRSSRQVNTILGAVGPAHRLMVVEILVPAGNRSELAAEHADGSDLEEVDHFRFRPPEGSGLLRLGAWPGSPEEELVVMNCDTVIVPGGKHTFDAAPRADAYYLRALAGDGRGIDGSESAKGPGDADASIGNAVDPRLPLVGR
jgi:5-deoxy-glucuronate isomerase